MRRATVILALALVSLINVSPVVAQDSVGPKAGTWGAEASPGTGALLRFRTPTSAWILSTSIFFEHVEEESTGPFPPSPTRDLVFGRISAGIRTYRRPQERVRPFTTLGAIVGYRNDFAKGWAFGGAGEIGTAYFFSSHVSLGVAGILSVVYERLEQGVGGGATTRTKSISANFDGFRFLGAVYF
jgi:hypothetical protein